MIARILKEDNINQTTRKVSMPYAPEQIANLFLGLAKADGYCITPIKMQKLIYYAHGWCLALLKQDLIDEEVEAWPYGSVIPSLFYKLSTYGNSPILEKISFTPDGCFDEIPKTDDTTRSLIARVWKVYKSYSDLQLSKMTHSHDSPWAQIRHKSNVKKGTDIPSEIIRKHFEDKAKAGKEASIAS